MEQHFQEVDKEVHYDKNVNIFSARFAQHFEQKQPHNIVVG